MTKKVNKTFDKSASNSTNSISTKINKIFVDFTIYSKDFISNCKKKIKDVIPERKQWLKTSKETQELHATKNPNHSTELLNRGPNPSIILSRLIEKIESSISKDRFLTPDGFKALDHVCIMITNVLKSIDKTSEKPLTTQESSIVQHARVLRVYIDIINSESHEILGVIFRMK